MASSSLLKGWLRWTLEMNLDSALQQIPASLRDPLIEQFTLLLKDYLHSDWEGVGTKAGKFCEIAYCVLEGILSGTYSSGPSKPNNFPASCDQLAQKYPTGSRAIRIQIPKVLTAIYEIRNNRAIGHIDPILNPSRMDAEFCLRSTKWVTAELVRHFSGSDVKQAAELVDHITVENISVVWEVGSNRRVLAHKLSHGDKVLALLYGQSKPTPAKDLLRWCEYSHSTKFRNEVLAVLHSSKLVEFDRTADTVLLSPTGHKEVESRNLLRLS